MNGSAPGNWRAFRDAAIGKSNERQSTDTATDQDCLCGVKLLHVDGLATLYAEDPQSVGLSATSTNNTALVDVFR